MNYKFSDGVSSLKPSLIREILKNTADSDTIPLAAGNPAPDAFPCDDVAAIMADVFKNNPITALQYGVTDGYGPLVKSVTQLCHERYGIGGENDAVIISSGAQQVMSMLSHALLNNGDVVICEEPSFIGALNCFRSFGAKLRGVRVDADGMNLSELEKALSEEKNAKFIYTIPNFQNPSGVTMSLEKRKGVYELAKKYGIIVLEDNPYGDIRVSGENLPSIKSFDEEGIVVYSGSFSKIVAPGIRVGFVCGPKEVVAKMTVVKQTQDVHTPLMSQLVVHKWLTEYDFPAHIEKIRTIYRKKLNLMCDSLDEYLSEFIEYIKPEGGMFVWCKLNDNIDMMEFCRRASVAGVAVVPGAAFMAQEDTPTQYIRLNFTTPADDKIVEGIRKLRDVALTF